MKVVLIGSGNVATVLGKKIIGSGHQVIQVVGRSFSKAQLLSSILKSSASDNVLKINDNADIYILAVADSFVADIAACIQLKNKIVVHTAGSLSRDLLKNSSSRYGVLYPLQSLRKEMVKLPDIPILVDGNTPEVVATLIHFCNDWAKSVGKCTDEQRQKLHVAAVIASNFTNYLYTIAEKYCKQENLNFNMLLPLIKETAQRIEGSSPASLQTGPAFRADTETIEKHRMHLNKYPNFKSIYNLMTESIIADSNVRAQ